MALRWGKRSPALRATITFSKNVLSVGVCLCVWGSRQNVTLGSRSRRNSVGVKSQQQKKIEERSSSSGWGVGDPLGVGAAMGKTFSRPSGDYYVFQKRFISGSLSVCVGVASECHSRFAVTEKFSRREVSAAKKNRRAKLELGLGGGRPFRGWRCDGENVLPPFGRLLRFPKTFYQWESVCVCGGRVRMSLSVRGHGEIQSA